jgi:hypothetical protein
MAANCEASSFGTDSNKTSSYKRHPTKADHKNSVWYYFLQGGKSAKCNIPTSGKIIKTVGGSTKGLHTHLLSKHDIDLLRKQSVADASFDANCTNSSAISKENENEFMTLTVETNRITVCKLQMVHSILILNAYDTCIIGLCLSLRPRVCELRRNAYI